MTINRFASPLHVKDDIDYLLLFETPTNSRVRRALKDISNDLEALSEMLRVVARWENGDYSDEVLLSGWNLYCKERGRVRYED